MTALIGPAAFAAQAVAPGVIPTTGPGPASRLGGPAPNTPGAELVDLLRSTSRKWSAATVGAQNSAALALASDTAVIGIGGFSGSDPAPTLDEFKGHVAAREVRWFVDGGPGPGTDAAPGAGSDGTTEIVTWVRENFEPTTVGDHTVYDLDADSP
jgi:hypothetical protein